MGKLFICVLNWTLELFFTQLVSSKITSLNGYTIPRLKLMGTLILARLIRYCLYSSWRNIEHWFCFLLVGLSNWSVVDFWCKQGLQDIFPEQGGEDPSSCGAHTLEILFYWMQSSWHLLSWFNAFQTCCQSDVVERSWFPSQKPRSPANSSGELYYGRDRWVWPQPWDKKRTSLLLIRNSRTAQWSQTLLLKRRQQGSQILNALFLQKFAKTVTSFRICLAVCI